MIAMNAATARHFADFSRGRAPPVAPVLLTALLLFAPARAAPDGADWDAAGAPGGRDCTACHFDAEAERASPLIELKGLPAKPSAGRTYALKLSLKEAPRGVAAFVLQAKVMCGSAGVFKATDARTEANGAGIRSTAAGLARAAGKPAWRFSWTAPATLKEPIVFYVAANLANDDASPFGDRILLATFEVDL